MIGVPRADPPRLGPLDNRHLRLREAFHQAQQIASASDLYLGEDIRYVELHGNFRDVQNAGDFFIGESMPNKFQYLCFPLGHLCPDPCWYGTDRG